MNVTAAQNPYAYLDRDIHDGSQWPQQKSTAPATRSADDAIAAGNASTDSNGMFGADGFGFDDFLDIINPLQHIPVISTLYREFTGDEIESGARMIGGGIFGGGLGLVAAVANSAIEAETGKDIGGHVMALISPLTGGVEEGDVAIGEAVTISWNSDRMPLNNLAEGTPVATMTLPGTEKVIDDATLLQLAAHTSPANLHGLKLKPGYEPHLAIPAAAPSGLDKATAAYAKTAALQTAVPAIATYTVMDDFAYLDNNNLR